MSRRETEALYDVNIPEDFEEYERTEREINENAKLKWNSMVEACAAEARTERKRLASTKKENALEDEYYQSRYDTLKSQLEHELGSDPTQCFFKLYKELILWHEADKPGLSPVEHAVSVFDTLDVSTKGLCSWLSFRKGKVPKERTERFGHLQRLTLFLTECANQLMDAVEDEDLMPSIKQDYQRGLLKFMGNELREKYEAVFGV
ncbi:hypothetical protein V5O48_014799 [Marasmius crinis-equi]|uniref:Uncharacterized protein n=1 Tax=Marasmius crinis-equi TaxID=585013 RepID=A0ABR3EW99_9AGAR